MWPQNRFFGFHSAGPSKMVMSPKIIFRGYFGKNCFFQKNCEIKNIQNFDFHCLMPPSQNGPPAKYQYYFDIHFLYRYFRYLCYVDNNDIDIHIITPLNQNITG